MKKIILFFIKGAIPTDEERAAAEKLGTYRFRNSILVKDSDPIEKCDAVAGVIPEIYKNIEGVEILEAEAIGPAKKPKDKKDPE